MGPPLNLRLLRQVVSGRWYALIPLPFGALAGLAAPTARIKKSWQAAFVIGFATLVPVVVAVAMAWLAAAPASAAG